MFDVEASYEFRMTRNGEEITFPGVVERYEHPLLKLKDSAPAPVHSVPAGAPADDDVDLPELPVELPAIPGAIINVTSPAFISAVRQVDLP